MKKLLLLVSVLFVVSCSSSVDAPAPEIKNTLTTAVNPTTGGTISPPSGQYIEIATVNITATPAADYVFSSWTGATGTTATTSVVMNSNKTVTANFVKKKYALTTSIEGEGTVTEKVIKAGAVTDYNSGTVVELTATPKAEWLFKEWTGDLTGTDNPKQITIDKAKTVTAVFVKKQYPLTVEIQGEGTVAEKVIKAGTATDYNSGTIVELTATAKAEWKFKEWSGDLTGTENPKEITIDKAKTVKAVFISNSGGGGGSGEPFTTTWVDIPSGTFTLRLKDYSNITIDWGDSSTSTHSDGIYPTHDYSSVGNYTISVVVNDVAKNIGQMFLKNHASKLLIRTIENWGEGKWSMMYQSYYGAANLTIPATDEPDLSVMNGQMTYTFRDCTSLVGTTFNDWDVSNVTTFMGTFTDAESFNGDISSWNTAAVTDMLAMFGGATAFNQDISSWNTALVTRMSGMFSQATAFNQDINTSGSSWDTSNVTEMSSMFREATAFNQDINGWDVSNVSDMNYMFGYATSFNQDLNNWTLRTAGVNLSYMFINARAFNQNISSWNTAAVSNMSAMFYQANAFNQDISSWNTANVTNMAQMFYQNTAFNGNISSWNTASVTNMSSMFQEASAFNQDIGSWNTASVTNMRSMFNNAAAFNQDLTNWCVTNITSEPAYFNTDSALTDANKPVWGTCPGNSYTIAVTASSNADYTLSGKDRNGDVSGNDPSLTFKVGDEVTFSVNASGHPFYLKTKAGTGDGNQISGVTNNGTTSGSVVWTPSTAGTYYYQCGPHAAMVGTITIEN